MKIPKEVLREFAVLTEGQLQQTLDAEQVSRLLDLMQQYPKLADALADDIHMDGLLYEMTEERPVDQRDNLSAGRTPSVFNPTADRLVINWRSLFLGTAISLSLLLVSAALVLMAVQFHRGTSEDVKLTLATITDTQNCEWRQATFSTEKGARLTAGRLELLAGVATLVFDCGAVVSLESESTLEIVNEKHCILANGRCVVTAEPAAAKGFVVETRFVTVTDKGTKFSLNVNKQAADVVVLEGQVKTWCPVNGSNTILNKDEMASYGTPVMWEAVPQKRGNTPRTVQLSTASPGGREAWVIADSSRKLVARRVAYYPYCDRFLLVKRGGYPANIARPYADRRVIFGIDTSVIRNENIEEVELKLSFGNTGLGFMTFVPDSRFVVYGLRDDQQDNWDEKTITWETLPGKNSDIDLDSSAYVPVGEFMMPHGVAEKTIVLNGAALKSFIKEDRNGFVTFVVEDKTPAVIGDSFVFGIAGRDHPQYSPPTLVFRMSEGQHKFTDNEN